MQGKGGVDTVPTSTEVWELASVGWEAGWEGSEVQQGRRAPAKSPSPAGGQGGQQPLKKQPLWPGAVGRSGSCKGCAQPAPSACPATVSAQLTPRSQRKEFASLPQKHSSGCKSKCMGKM